MKTSCAQPMPAAEVSDPRHVFLGGELTVSTKRESNDLLKETHLGTENRLFKMGLLSLASGLREQSTGASDPWARREILEVKAYLYRRVATWDYKQTTPERTRYDTAVRELVLSALLEVEAREGKLK